MATARRRGGGRGDGNRRLGWWVWPQRRDAPLDREWPAVVATLAGDGIAEWRDGNIVHARFADPFDVAIAADGTIFVSDGVAHRIRALRPDGTVTTIAGGERGFADGPAAEARFDTPSGLALDASGTLYVADTGNNAIRRDHRRSRGVDRRRRR